MPATVSSVTWWPCWTGPEEPTGGSSRRHRERDARAPSGRPGPAARGR
jgi:hypothetical protein